MKNRLIEARRILLEDGWTKAVMISQDGCKCLDGADAIERLKAQQNIIHHQGDNKHDLSA